MADTWTPAPHDHVVCVEENPRTHWFEVVDHCSFEDVVLACFWSRETAERLARMEAEALGVAYGGAR